MNVVSFSSINSNMNSYSSSPRDNNTRKKVSFDALKPMSSLLYENIERKVGKASAEIIRDTFHAIQKEHEGDKFVSMRLGARSVGYGIPQLAMYISHNTKRSGIAATQNVKLVHDMRTLGEDAVDTVISQLNIASAKAQDLELELSNFAS